MRLTLAVTGATVTGTLGEATLTRRHTQPYDPDRVRALTHEAMAALRRGARERALGARNLADLRHVGEELYLALLPEEIRTALRTHAGPLLLELDETLVAVPWELLFDGEQFFCRRYPLGRAVATHQAVPGVPAPTPTPPLRVLILAVDADGDLPEVTREGEALVAALDGQPGLRAHLVTDADPARVRRLLKEFDAVHFAGHAEHDAAHPERSGWRLRGGVLRAADVVALAGGSPLPLLIFANGCRSTQTDAWSGSDPGAIYGLANAFLLAGVRYYVGTQWDLADRHGPDLAVRFWTEVAAGQTVGGAMTRARATVAASGESDLAWAPYVLYGAPDFAPLAASGPAPLPADRRDLVPRPGALAARRSAPYKTVGLTKGEPPTPALFPHLPVPPPIGRRRLLAVAVVAVATLGGGTLLVGRWLHPGGASGSGAVRTLALLGVGTGTSLEGGAEAHAAAMESCLLGALAHHGHYRLVDRARISALKRTRPADFDRPGTQTAAAAGRELRADYVVYGEVAVVGGKPFFSIFCADPATHQVIFGDNLDGFDARGCDAVARRLLQRLDEIGRANASE